jgi:L-asparaginase
MHITFITTGGTIDKVYFDAQSRFEVGETTLEHMLRQGEVAFDYAIVPLMRKDSLELDAADRAAIRAAIEASDDRRFVITHGTDTMVETALALEGIEDRVIVLTGALSPARFQQSDAPINIGLALGAAQTCPPGVYLAMNGRIFPPHGVRKNRERNRFERVGGVGT